MNGDQRGRRPRDRLALVLALLGAAALACAGEPERGPGPATRPAFATLIPSATAPAPPADPYATQPPAATPLSVDPVVAAVAAALQGVGAGGLAPLLLDEVTIGSEQDTANLQQVPRGAALAWLDARWGERRRVLAASYVEHFVLIEIETEGWLPLGPGESGELAFHLHRYDAAGRPDPLAGEWRIDGLFYR